MKSETVKGEQVCKKKAFLFAFSVIMNIIRNWEKIGDDAEKCEDL